MWKSFNILYLDFIKVIIISVFYIDNISSLTQFLTNIEIERVKHIKMKWSETQNKLSKNILTNVFIIV